MDLFSQAEHDEMAQAILLVARRRAARRASRASARRVSSTAMPRARDHRGVARAPRRADPACAISTRPARSPTASRPSTSSSPSPTPTRCCRRSATPARSSSATTRREALGDYCAGPNHVLPTGAHRALFVAARRLRFPEALERDRVSRERRAHARARSRPTLARGEGLAAHARSAEARDSQMTAR